MNFIEEIIEKGAKRNLKFRFPPEPNGYLHLGHVKAAALNFGLAEKYGVSCNLRFDDTNPLTEDSIFTDAIKEDLDWLGFDYGEAKFTSDYFRFLHGMAVKLIMFGHAYVDDSTSEEIAEMKGDLENPGTNSPYRNRDVDENIKLFDLMCKGERDGVLRAKIDMASPNMIMRDPVIYRVIDVAHHHTGEMYKAYPMYDFAHPLSDWLEGISHSLCTLEFEVHRPFYDWLLRTLDIGKPFPRQIEFSRLNVEGIDLSKRKLKEYVDEGIVDGWDDPRMPTLRGLRRRGFTPDSIKAFCEKVGVTKNESVIERALLDECLRDELNNNCLRKMVVLDPIKLTIRNFPDSYTFCEVENNPSDESAGKRSVKFNGELYIEREDFREEANRKYHRLKLGGEVRLKGACVVKAVDCIKDDDGNIIEVICDYDPMSWSGMELDRKVKGTIHWVPRLHSFPIKVREFDGMDVKTTTAYAEWSINEVDDSYPVQFMRKGYYILDAKLSCKELVFNSTVPLKSSFKG